MSTAVATTQHAQREKPEVPRRLEEFSGYEKDKQAIVLRPVETVMQHDNPLFVTYATVIRWNPESDFYPTPGKNGHKSLTKKALRRLAAAANISILESRRLDNGTDPDYAEFTTRVAMRMPDGTFRYGVGSAQFRVQVMLDQDEAAAKKKSKTYDRAANENTYRRFAAQRCESLAINRAIRDILVIESSYSESEIQKPFVVPVVAPNTEYMAQFPEGRQLMFAQALGATGMLYPAAQQSHAQAPALPPAATPASLPDSASSDANAGEAAVIVEAVELPDFDDEEDKTEDNRATIRRLLAEREITLTDDKVETMLAAAPEKQIKYIDWLAGFPFKAQPQGEPQAKEKAGVLTAPQVKRLYAIAKKAGYDSPALHEVMARKFGGITSTSDLSRDQYNELCGDEKKGIESWLLANPKGGAQ